MKKLAVLALTGVATLSGVASASASNQDSQHNGGQAAKLAYSEPVYPSPWMNPEADGWREAYVKAKAFVSQLTLMEKVNLTTGVGWQSERCVGNTGSIPRLGFRGFCLQDGPLGLRFSDYNSVFPAGLTTAATWDRKHMYDRGFAMGREHKEKGVNVALGPVAGPIGRVVTGGRNWEGFSPDPYLTGVAMAETVKGMQAAGVIATAKHFIGNEQERFRQVGESKDPALYVSESLSSNIDDKTMHELYLWPFQDAVRAGVGAVMCSYTQVNNSYGCANSKTLNGLLKSELGFQGFVMADWQAQHSGVSAAVAGLDMTMPGDTVFQSNRSYWGANLTIAAINGTVPLWRIDDMAMRIMASFFKVGQTVENQVDINFSSWTRDTYGPVYWTDPKSVNSHINHQVDVRGDHAQLIRTLAADATVLLKNVNGTLPLKKPKFLAVIGEDAGGNPRGPNGCPDRGCNRGTLGQGWGSGTSSYSYLVTPDSALQARALQDGTRYESVLDNYAADAIHQLVTQPEVTAVVFVNADSGEGFITVDDNDGDRKNLTLWANGDELVRNVSSWCSNTIVVIHSVGPVLIDEYANHPNITAMLWAALPGQESGNSITDILYGRINPGGKSPFTWAKKLEDYGVSRLERPNNGRNAPQDDFSEGVFIDYRRFDKYGITPTYEFGYGLSYTTFKYSNLVVVKRMPPAYAPPPVKKTLPAPFIGPSHVSNNINDYRMPHGGRVDRFIYPYLEGDDLASASGDANYGQPADKFLPRGTNDSSSQPVHLAGGNSGGNPRLFDVMYHVEATITNTGSVIGDEVVQMYLTLDTGKKSNDRSPRLMLRGFDRLRIEPGKSATFKADVTRRDLSHWDVVSQNWVVPNTPKKLWVGSSSRKLHLAVDLV